VLVLSLRGRSSDTVLSYMLWVILKTSIISPRKRLYFRHMRLFTCVLIVFHCNYTGYLSCTVCETLGLALIFLNFKRSHYPECTPYCGILTCTMIIILVTFNLQTKFQMSSFICSRDMAWASKCRNESRDPDHAPFGLKLATINLYMYQIWLLTAPVTKIRKAVKM